jgi:large subunit ribosomal protein L10
MEDGSMPAKSLRNTGEKRRGKNPCLKGASIDTELYIGEDKLESLSALKSREELIGEIIALLQSPAKNVIGALFKALRINWQALLKHWQKKKNKYNIKLI